MSIALRPHCAMLKASQQGLGSWGIFHEISKNDMGSENKETQNPGIGHAFPHDNCWSF